VLQHDRYKFRRIPKPATPTTHTIDDHHHHRRIFLPMRFFLFLYTPLPQPLLLKINSISFWFHKFKKWNFYHNFNWYEYERNIFRSERKLQNCISATISPKSSYYPCCCSLSFFFKREKLKITWMQNMFAKYCKSLLSNIVWVNFDKFANNSGRRENLS
jgi:hypothetical protein